MITAISDCQILKETTVVNLPRNRGPCEVTRLWSHCPRLGCYYARLVQIRSGLSLHPRWMDVLLSMSWRREQEVAAIQGIEVGEAVSGD